MSINYRADHWFLGHEKSVKPKQSGLGSGSKLTFKPGSAVTNLKSAAYKKPEVMVKIPKRKSSEVKGLTAAIGHIDYISRNGKLMIEDQDGQKYEGKKNIHTQVIDKWRSLGIPDNSKYKESLNVVLSMPAGTNPQAVNNAAREFAKDVFKGHHYVFAQHLDEDHPHMHFCVTMRDDMGRRMNPRKNDLFQWRVLFAEKMRDEGVDCAATKRQHRGITQKAEKGTIRNIKKRGEVPRIDKAEIQELIQAIKTNQRPLNPFLAEQIKTREYIREQYGQIARELYKEGFKTEAKAISQLSKNLETAPITTKAQEKFDLAKKQSINVDTDFSIEP